MVINDEEEDSTMKQYGTAPGQGKYKPDFMEHFDKKDGNNIERSEEEKVKPEPNTSLQVTQEEKLVKEKVTVIISRYILLLLMFYWATT